MMKNYLIIWILIFPNLMIGSDTTKVLFIGNSYTGVNDLPKLFKQVSESAGKFVLAESSNPGGFTFSKHLSNSTSQALIKKEGWNFVVLQEQSQLPSFPDQQFFEESFPFAHSLDSQIHVYNSCAQTVFYQTWGRKNGDAQICSFFPPVCTYEGMDSLLSLRYRIMADSNLALLSPVGKVWNYIRKNYPEIELYQTDESHPSEIGSYAAAVTFFTLIHQENPEHIKFSYTLDTITQKKIVSSVLKVVFDSLKLYNINQFNPISEFTFQNLGMGLVQFKNLSKNSTSLRWYFGDGDSSNTLNPVHQYLQQKSYQVMLIAEKCNVQDTFIQKVDLFTGISKQSTIINFSKSINSDLLLIKNTTGDKTHYTIYNIEGKKVMETVLEAYQEISIDFTNQPQGIYILKDNIHFNQKIIKL